MHSAISTRAAAQVDTDQAGPEVVVPLLRMIAAQLAEIRAQLDGKTKSHYTIEEIAIRTGRSPYTVRKWVSAGRITAARVSGTGPRGRLLVPRAELEKLITGGLVGESTD